jgi:hypothetical protein
MPAISAVTNAWRMSKDSHRLKKILELYAIGQASHTPRPYVLADDNYVLDIKVASDPVSCRRLSARDCPCKLSITDTWPLPSPLCRPCFAYQTCRLV